MTEYVLKDDQAVCTGSEMKLVLMNSARQVREKGWRGWRYVKAALQQNGKRFIVLSYCTVAGNVWPPDIRDPQ